MKVTRLLPVVVIFFSTPWMAAVAALEKILARLHAPCRAPEDDDDRD